MYVICNRVKTLRKKKKALFHIINAYKHDNTCTYCLTLQGYSCVDLLNAGMRDSGVYYLQIRGTTYWFLKVYCEQDIAEGGWTVKQRFVQIL